MPEFTNEATPKNELDISPEGQAVLSALLERRSYREFTTEEVSTQAMEIILECARNAPSSKNAQPWRLHPVMDKAKINEIADLLNDPAVLASRPIDPKTGLPNENYAATIKESGDAMRSGAAVAIVIENRSPFMGGRQSVLESPYAAQAMRGHEFEMLGIGAAVENMYLAVGALHLGGVFMGDIVIKDDDIRKKLGMQGDLIGVFIFGHPAKIRAELWDKPLESSSVTVAQTQDLPQQ